MRILPALMALPLMGQTAAAPRAYYDRVLSRRAVPLLQEVLRFPTVAGDEKARRDQQDWLRKIGTELGLTVRDAGLVTEIELPGPEGAPVLGLVVHGDVQPVDPKSWTFPPFGGVVRGGRVLGRGAADDKGPLVQALLALKALKETTPRRTHTIRLLVGSDEESGSTDMAEYLKTHVPPSLSLVLDANFTVTVGEKAWVGFWVDSRLDERGKADVQVLRADAGLAPSIVPDRAELALGWRSGSQAEAATDSEAKSSLLKALKSKPLPRGISLEVKDAATAAGQGLQIIVHGKAAHGGVNLEGGRNALVGLARLMEGKLPKGGLDDLLSFTRLAGQDIYGSSLGIPRHPVFGPTTVNPATLKVQPDGSTRLFINLRRTPALSGAQLKAHLEKVVAEFNARSGAQLKPGGWWEDEPLVFDPQAKVVKRLLAAYARGAGKAEGPNISGGGTYAKRLPNAIAFGMWFPGSGPYPGHDTDEQAPIVDLHRGVHVLLEALGDLACGEPMKDPFKP